MLLDDLKIILHREIRDLQGNLEESHYKSRDAADRLMSRTADRNDMIRINTLRWVLELIENLEQKSQ